MPKPSPASRQKLRSRAYPAITLSEAIGLLRQIQKQIGLDQRDRNTIAQALGYAGGHSGIAARKTAALGHFGLMDVRDGLYSPTGLAEDILDEGNETRYRTALREACLSPTLFREIIRRYEPVGRVPRQLALTLSLDHGIQEQARDEVAHIFMESARFAGILESDGTFRSTYFEATQRPGPITLETPALPADNESVAAVSVPMATAMPTGKPQDPRIRILCFPVTDQKEIEIRLPQHCNEEDIELLKMQVDFLERQVKLNRPDQPVRLDVYRDRKRQ